MLAPDPADRPQSARELLSMIHRCQTKFSAEAQSRRRRSALAAVGTTFIIAAIAAGIWLSHRFQFSVDSERSIAVLPFKEFSPKAEDSPFGIGSPDEIIDDPARLRPASGAARGRGHLAKRRFANSEMWFCESLKEIRSNRHDHESDHRN